MNSFTLALKLTSAHIKRLKSYIPQLIVSVLILLAICLLLATMISDRLFSSKQFSAVQIGYYLPEDDDMKYNTLAISMVEDMESVSEVARLQRVYSEAEGYKLLNDGDILFFIIVPEGFFSGIMDGTNPRLTIAIENYDTITTYIASELLMSYARYLGVAQAGIYSGLDTIREQGGTAEEENRVLNNTNIIYMERALNHDNYLDTVDAKDAGDFTLAEHYTAAALILVLCFSGFILSLWLSGTNKGLISRYEAMGVNTFTRFIASFLACVPAIYIACLPCIIAIWVYTGTVKISALLTILPIIILTAFFICLVCYMTPSVFSANLVIFFITMLIMYIGGGLVPNSFLPELIQHISPYLPGEPVIRFVSGCLF